MTSELKQRGVQSVETGGQVLQHLSEHRAPIMLRDLAQKMGIAPAQLHPYLVSFKMMGMVEQTAQGLYQLGPFALRLGLARLQIQDGYRDTLDQVDALAQDLDLMVSVSVWGPYGPVITYVCDRSEPMHANVKVGGHYAMTGTATGRVFAAFLADEISAPLIAAEGRQDTKSYQAELVQIASQGYATTRDLPIPGVSAIAAPVFDHTGHLVHCVTIIGPSERIDLSKTGPHVNSLLVFTKRRSHDLGYEDSNAG